MSQEKDRRDVIAFAEAHGWTYVTGGKYGKLKCPCGLHQTWLHWTPSNPNYWKERKRVIARPCPSPRETE